MTLGCFKMNLLLPVMSSMLYRFHAICYNCSLCSMQLYLLGYLSNNLGLLKKINFINTVLVLFV